MSSSTNSTSTLSKDITKAVENAPERNAKIRRFECRIKNPPIKTVHSVLRIESAPTKSKRSGKHIGSAAAKVKRSGCRIQGAPTKLGRFE